MRRPVFTVIGLLLIVAGVLWALQGAGLVMWPSSSFMLQEDVWIVYGLGTAALGVLLLVLGRRRR